MLTAGPHKTMLAEIAKLVHSDQLKEAANCWLDFVGVDPLKDDEPGACYTVLMHPLQWALNNHAQEEAAQILWPPQLFNPNPRCSRLVWDLYDRSNFGLIMGGGSLSKSYTMGVRLMLEWVRDPFWTTVRVLGPSEEHLESNLFSHLVALHQQSKIPLPGTLGSLFIGMDRRDRTSSISGVVIPLGSSKSKSGKLQGTKRKNRTEPHPVFGAQTRLLVFLDEIENIPKSIWGDIDNLMTNLSPNDLHGLKIFGAYNPTDRESEVGRRAEPDFGWDNFDPETHEVWRSRRGWDVVRLDALRCENVIEGRVVYPGLQTLEGVKQIERNSGGVESAGYCAMVRAVYPPRGSRMSVIPVSMVTKIKAIPLWYSKPINVGACDLALEGGAKALFTKGLWGLATGVEYPLNPANKESFRKMFKDDSGSVRPRYVLFVEDQFALPRGKTRAMTDLVRSACYRLAIRPEHLCIDRTGHGQGVADLLATEWSPAVVAVNFSEATSGLKVMLEDAQTSKEMFDRVNSELWFAMKAFFEFEYIWISPDMDTSSLIPQLTQRFYRVVGGKSRVETKRDYMSRNNPSPDEADSLSLLVHGVRKSSGYTPSMSGRPGIYSEDGGYDDLPGGQFIDSTMKQESLE